MIPGVDILLESKTGVKQPPQGWLYGSSTVSSDCNPLMEKGNMCVTSTGSSAPTIDTPIAVSPTTLSRWLEWNLFFLFLEMNALQFNSHQFYRIHIFWTEDPVWSSPQAWGWWDRLHPPLTPSTKVLSLMALVRMYWDKTGKDKNSQSWKKAWLRRGSPARKDSKIHLSWRVLPLLQAVELTNGLRAITT